MQDVWRRPATGRSVWERSCPPRGSACAGGTTQMLRRPQGLLSLGAPGKSSTDFPSTPAWVPPPGLLHLPPKQAGLHRSPWKWGWRSCACAAGCWWGLSIGLGPEGGSLWPRELSMGLQGGGTEDLARQTPRGYPGEKGSRAEAGVGTAQCDGHGNMSCSHRLALCKPENTSSLATALPSPQGRTLCTATLEHIRAERVKLQMPGVVSTPEPPQ